MNATKHRLAGGGWGDDCCESSVCLDYASCASERRELV